jgi:cytosine/adenosine deaminase-related metal-dependent hydrolase
MTTTTVILAGRLLTASHQGTSHMIPDAALVIQDGTVLYAGPRADLPDLDGDVVEIDATASVVMPGLVDAHHHVGLTPTQLGVPDDALELWIARRHGPPAVDPYLDTVCGAEDLLAGGVTTVQHLNGRLRGDPEQYEAADTAVLRAYADVGMRVSYSRGLTDQNRFVYSDDEQFIASLPPAEQAAVRTLTPARYETPEEQLASSYTRLREKWHGAADGRIAIQLAPANLHWCSEELLLAAAEISARDDVGMHMHLSETPYQEVYADQHSGGRTAVRYLHERGLLSTRLTLGHAVWIDDSDIDLLAASGTLVCHNPSSNLRLRSGLAPTALLRANGVRLALGIDEAGLADDRDMFSEIRLAWALTQEPGQDTTARTTAAHVLDMALEDSAATTPFAGRIGRLEPGYAADFLVLDWESVTGAYLDPTADPIDAVVRRARPTALRQVYVNGELVFADGQATKVDGPAIRTELRRYLAGRQGAEQQDRQAAAEALEGAVARFYTGHPWSEWREITTERASWNNRAPRTTTRKGSK